MKNKKEFNNLTDEEIDEEIKARKKMINQMVGWLYPSILSGEIETLLELKKDPLRRTRVLLDLERVVLDKQTKNRPY